MKLASLTLLLILLLLNTSNLRSQDLAGTWIGSGTTTHYVELAIVRNGSNYVGFSYDEGMGHCKANFKGTYDSSTKTLKGKGMGFIEKTFGHGQGTFNLKYSHSNGTDYLKGYVWPKSLGVKILSFGIPSTVNLTRKNLLVDTTAFMKQSLTATESNVTPKNTGSPSTEEQANEAVVEMKESRVTDTLQTIITNERKITVKLFDNGVEDNDIVSILHKGKIVVRQQLISSKPFEFEIALNPGDDEHDITLVAHNVGSIPPNTAMVVIEAGNNKYSLTASSSLSRNAMIRVRYDRGQ